MIDQLFGHLGFAGDIFYPGACKTFQGKDLSAGSQQPIHGVALARFRSGWRLVHRIPSPVSWESFSVSVYRIEDYGLAVMRLSLAALDRGESKYGSEYCQS